MNNFFPITISNWKLYFLLFAFFDSIRIQHAETKKGINFGQNQLIFAFLSVLLISFDFRSLPNRSMLINTN